MEYLVLQGLLVYIGTVVVSFGMFITNDMKKFKDVADNGYKLNHKKYDYYSNNIMENKRIAITLLIPVVNIAYVLSKAYMYSLERPMIVDKLNAMGCLTPMSEEEIKKYKDDPCILNALEISMNPKTEKPKQVDGLEKQERLLEERKKLYEELDKVAKENERIFKELLTKEVNGELTFPIEVPEKYSDFESNNYSNNVKNKVLVKRKNIKGGKKYE